MRTAAAPPFVLPPQDVVVAGPWRNDTGPVPDHLPDWDPHTDLALVRELEIDLGRLRDHSKIGSRATTALLASWSSSTTRLSGSGPVVELGDLNGVVQADLEVEIPGRLAGGRLELSTTLVLRDGDPAAPPIAARRPGSILWSDVHSLVVEGAAARFPMTAVRFSELPGVPGGAAWYLDWNPEDLEEPATGALRLLINADREDVIAAVRTGALAPGAEAVRSFIRYDVARALVHAALQSDRFVDCAEGWEEESLGRLLAELIEQVWPDVPVSSLRARLADDPARIDADLQNAFRLEAA